MELFVYPSYDEAKTAFYKKAAELENMGKLFTAFPITLKFDQKEGPDLWFKSVSSRQDLDKFRGLRVESLSVHERIKEDFQRDLCMYLHIPYLQRKVIKE